MRRALTTLILSLATAAVPLPTSLAQTTPTTPATQPAATAPASNIPVKIVVLYSSGVGYFQHAGTVSDNASTELRFKTDQINDVLKSLVLQDLDKGTVSAITYPSLDPVSKTLASFQINIADNPALHDLLNQLRGSRVSLDLGTDKLTGTILGVEKKPRPTRDDEKKVIELPILNLLVDDTIKSVDFEQIRSVKLDDPQLQSELTQALTALAQSRDKDKKPVTINFAGQGDRRVSVGYVVETPIWKTSYRLVLSSDPETKPQLQGWALIENQTDTDWSNVQLSLVSGRPISFIQDLYQPLYVPRPTVTPELYASLRPQTYDDGTGTFAGRGVAAAKSPTAGAPAAPGQQPMRQRLAERRLGDVVAEDLGLQVDALSRERAVAADELEAKKHEYFFARLNAASGSVASLASAAKLGELFQYTIPAVSLPRQKSAMLPIVTDPIDAQRVSIYNAAVLQKNPLNGALLKNTTGKHLLGGPVTVFDANAYAGDARIDSLPPDQSRLISFGVDLQVRVNSTTSSQTSVITAGKIVKGVLEVTRKHHASQTYECENRADRDKTLILEHPLQPNWTLVNTPDPMEKTESLYRFKHDLKANQSARFTVQTEHTAGQAIAILPCDIGQLQFYATSGQIPAPVKEALAKAIQLKQALVDTERQLTETQQQIDAITNEQSRLRENMKTVDRQSQYYTRLMTKLNDQESQIEKLRDTHDTLRKTQSDRRTELETYLANTTIG